MTLQELLKQPEGKTLEFKRDLSSIEPIMKTLVAFANTAGGTLIIGVDDDKKVVGVEDVLAMEEKITSCVADNIVPLLLPIIKIAPVGRKSIVIIEIASMFHLGPFYLKQKGRDKGVMVRLGSSTRQATPEIIKELEIRRQSVSFDAMPCLQATEEDLDRDLLKKTFENVAPKLTQANLKTLKILVNYGKQLVPSNAGIILFGTAEIRQEVFPMAVVSCARFAGIDKVHFIDQQDIDSILAAVDEVPKFIRRNTRMGAIIETIKRQDIPEYSPVAIREGLLNALMHADYSYNNLKHFVSIFDDRLEIRSPGILPPGMTIESLKEGISIPRNMVIAGIFKKLGWIEQFGTGYRRIKEACERDNYPIPEWRESALYVDITFKQRGQAGDKKELRSGQEAWAPSMRQKAILGLFAKQSQMTIKDIVQQLENPPTTRSIRTDLAILQEHGLVRLEGFGRSAIWILHYSE
jgi:ATP-dependent DNA helicase RecG